MESSKRAVEAYRRTRLIDAVTSDDDHVAPVYKLEEISSVLRSSSYDVVHEMVEYVFKRLEHKSPYVKQKTLRFIKFTVGKSGSEFKREIQRQSPAVKQLFHYQGQPDPLRGDSLNKAVRETAKEAVAAIFEEKSESAEGTRTRIEGFGSSNFDARPVQEKKTLLSEVVDIGAASIKQGLSILSNHYGQFSTGNGNGVSKNLGGSYEAPNIRRTISERESYRESYRESRDSYADSYRGGYTESRETYETKVSLPEPGSPEASDETSDGDQEEKLLDAVTPTGGVRLQPSREALHNFLIASQKLNALKLAHAFEHKLQAHSWQVRFKALCFLEAVVRQRSLKTFGDIAVFFTEDSSCIIDCSESPQNTLRDKAKKILDMLNGGTETGGSRQTKKPAAFEMPDLMDTNPSTEVNGSNGLDFLNTSEDLLGTTEEVEAPQAENIADDPFAGLDIHNSDTTPTTKASKTSGSLLDIFSEGPEAPSSLFEGLSVTEEPVKQPEDLGLDWRKESGSSKQPAATKPDPWQELQTAVNPNSWQQPAAAPATVFPPTHPGAQPPQVMYLNPYLIPAAALQSGLFLQQAFAQGGMSPATMGQQQQQHYLGSFSTTAGGLDAFDFSGNPYAPSSVAVPKVEETTKAFDFISDHVAAARTVKK